MVRTNDRWLAATAKGEHYPVSGIHPAATRSLNPTRSKLGPLNESKPLLKPAKLAIAGRVEHAMHPTSTTASHLPLDHVRRVSRSFVELNARIARLAMLVGAPLSNEQDIQNIIHHPTDQIQDSTATPAVAGRTAQEWNELRGLLVLRSNLIAQMLDDLGLDLTEQVVQQAEEHLERVGFKRGADGFHMPASTPP